jgi:stage III sporulation protein AG
MVPRRAEDDYRARLERDLAAALRRIRGVGEVVVLVTLESGPSYVYGENSEAVRRTTQEEDGGGGRRSIAEDTHRTQVVITRDGGTEKPLVSREIQPELRGVMVIAQGAADPYLREEIIRALQAGLNLPAHRVTVLPMK